jgi:3-oxoacyl-(acyl-carrier-protein) synthase
MRILGPVVLPLVLAMLDTGHELLLGCVVALQLGCDEHSRDIPQPLSQLAEEFLSRLLVSATLDQDVQYVAILIHCTPEVMEVR